MATFPLVEAAQRCEGVGAVTSTSRGTACTANASANTKATSFTQLIASTAFHATGILVMLDDCAATIDYLIDIAVGASSSEVVILSNLLASGGTGSLVYGMHYFFPVNIPAGTRISARIQASTGSSVIRISGLLFSGGMLAPETLAIVTPYGPATADSGAVSIDPGGSANTKPATFTTIAASTSFHTQFLSFAIGNQLNATRSSQSWLMDIAIGAAGSEVVILPNIALNCSTSPDIVVPQSINMLPVNIPAGTRLSARAQSDGIDATDRLFDLALYGVT